MLSTSPSTARTSASTSRTPPSDGDYVTNRSAVVGIGAVLSLAGTALAVAVWIAVPAARKEPLSVVQGRETRSTNRRQPRPQPVGSRQAADPQKTPLVPATEPDVNHEDDTAQFTDNLPGLAEDVTALGAAESPDELPEPPLRTEAFQPKEYRKEFEIPSEPAPAGLVAGIDDPSDVTLLQYLESTPKTLDLETVRGTSAKLLSAKKDTVLRDLVASREDLRGLPLREASLCRLNKDQGKIVEALSREFHGNDARIRRKITLSTRSHSGRGQRLDSLDQQFGVADYDAYFTDGYDEFLNSCIATKKAWHRPEAVSSLVQMLQVARTPVRRELVNTLACIEGREASEALAARALFDVEEQVRGAARARLSGRAKEEYRHILLAGLRYPWAPVANHAAQALVSVNDQQAIDELAALLDAPNPQSPFLNDDKKWVKKEVVRVNHLRNCLLCHAPSPSAAETDKPARQRRVSVPASADDLVRGLIPTPGRPLGPVYYSSRRGNFVHADVTYLKQDFSLMCKVENHGVWPAYQRFDYFVRTRELSDVEVLNLLMPGWLPTGDKDPATLASIQLADYPQREAVLYAWRKLTELRAGSSGEDRNRPMKSGDQSKTSAVRTTEPLWKTPPESR